VRLRVLGCSGAELPGHNPTAFLLDDNLLLDAGTVGSVLNEDEQCRLTDILITHPHLDHIRGIPALADNFIMTGVPKSVQVFSTEEVLSALRSHLLNGVIWPDFSKIPSEAAAVIRYRLIVPQEQFTVAGFAVTASLVNHTVPAVGYRITKGASTLLYTGDTGPTDQIWETAQDVSALIVEVSFPSEMKEMAILTGHLTPLLLKAELAKLKKLPPRIFITHLKPQYYDRIKPELDALMIPGIELLQEGTIYEI
jgi:ribonuclease BN (tRNA processing enzyme)